MNRRNTIGLRHIIEGSIRILEGEPIDQTRGKYLLEAMRRFLMQAEEGLGFVHDRAWVVPPSGSDALDSYHFVDNHIGNSMELDLDIALARESIDLTYNKKTVPRDKLIRTIKILKSLLESMKTERDRYAEDRLIFES